MCVCVCLFVCVCAQNLHQDPGLFFSTKISKYWNIKLYMHFDIDINMMRCLSLNMELDTFIFLFLSNKSSFSCFVKCKILTVLYSAITSFLCAYDFINLKVYHHLITRLLLIVSRSFTSFMVIFVRLYANFAGFFCEQYFTVKEV